MVDEYLAAIFISGTMDIYIYIAWLHVWHTQFDTEIIIPRKNDPDQTKITGYTSTQVDATWFNFQGFAVKWITWHYFMIHPTAAAETGPCESSQHVASPPCAMQSGTWCGKESHPSLMVSCGIRDQQHLSVAIVQRHFWKVQKRLSRVFQWSSDNPLLSRILLVGEMSRDDAGQRIIWTTYRHCLVTVAVCSCWKCPKIAPLSCGTAWRSRRDVTLPVTWSARFGSQALPFNRNSLLDLNS